MNMASQGITTENAGFRELLSRIELNASRAELASQRYNAVKQRVKTALPGKDVLQVGSFKRNTKIRPVDDEPLDIDLIVCFGDALRYASGGSGGTTPAKALETVRSALLADDTYRVMAPTSDAPTVVLEYADGFRIELAPCFRDLTGTRPRPNGPACYIVGTSSGSWAPADYDYDAAYISGANQDQAVAGSLVPAIKMVKRFFRNHSVELKSFHVEIICALIVPGVVAKLTQRGSRWNFGHLLVHILDQSPSHLNGPVAIPGSYSPSVDCGLSVLRRREMGQYLAQCAAKARGICNLGDGGSDRQALEQWRKFFGDPFPG